MCNLYEHRVSIAEANETLRQIGRELDAKSRARNYEPGLTGADSDGPVILSDGKTSSVETMRWGFPGIPPKDEKKRPKPITNIRNLNSGWWKNVNGEFLLEPEYRCLVPFHRFAEPDKVNGGNAWFRTTGSETSFFAGIWRPWDGERLKPVEGKKRRQWGPDDWRLYAFLTTEPNEVVAPIHPKAMPVVLTYPDECAEWMGGGADSLRLQRPYPADQMELMAR